MEDSVELFLNEIACAEYIEVKYHVCVNNSETDWVTDELNLPICLGIRIPTKPTGFLSHHSAKKVIVLYMITL